MPLSLLFIVPFELYAHYNNEILPELSSSGSLYFANQSFLTSIERIIMLWNEQKLNLPEYSITTILRITSFILLACFSLAALYIRLKDNKNADFGLNFAALAMVGIIAPIAWGHSWVLAMPFITLMVLRSQFKVFYDARSFGILHIWAHGYG